MAKPARATVGAYDTVVGILSAVTSARQEVNTNPDNAFNGAVTGAVQVLVAALAENTSASYASQLFSQNVTNLLTLLPSSTHAILR